MGKNLGVNEKAVLVAILFLITTPWWWVYGRLGLGLLPNVLMIGTIWATIVNPSKRRIIFASLATFFAVAASWHGVFLMPFLWFQTWRRRRFDRVTLALIGASALGGLVIFFWITQGGGLSELGNHIGERVEKDWTWGEFVERQWHFAKNLLPIWYLVLALPALASGLIDSRTRFLTTSLSLMVLTFAIVPSNGAWIHDYWNFPILLALFPGFTVMSEWVISAIRERFKIINRKAIASIGSGALLFLVLLAALKPTELHEKYFIETSDAGILIAEIKLPRNQRTAWHLPQVPWPTWVSNKWGMSARSLLNAEDLGTVPSDDVVLFRIDRMPDWLEKEIEFVVEQREGRYAVLEAHVMKQYVVEVQK